MHNRSIREGSGRVTSGLGGMAVFGMSRPLIAPSRPHGYAVLTGLAAPTALLNPC